MGIAAVGKKRLRVAIDGPAGAGKSTVARKVARSLGYLYLDTGAMYRALAVTALDRGISLDDGDALQSMARSVKLEVGEDKGVFRVWVDGCQVTDRLRELRTDEAVKMLAMVRPVRETLVNLQRDMANRGGVVMEGRDTTSVVVPDAEVKVFLTADLEERASRRWKELRDRGVSQEFHETLRQIQQRDQKDLERDWGKLVMVPGAHLIDTTCRTIDEVCALIVALCEAKTTCSTGF